MAWGEQKACSFLKGFFVIKMPRPAGSKPSVETNRLVFSKHSEKGPGPGAEAAATGGPRARESRSDRGTSPRAPAGTPAWHTTVWGRGLVGQLSILETRK